MQRSCRIRRTRIAAPLGLRLTQSGIFQGQPVDTQERIKRAPRVGGMMSWLTKISSAMTKKRPQPSPSTLRRAKTPRADQSNTNGYPSGKSRRRSVSGSTQSASAYNTRPPVADNRGDQRGGQRPACAPKRNCTAASMYAEDDSTKLSAAVLHPGRVCKDRSATPILSASIAVDTVP